MMVAVVGILKCRMVLSSRRPEAPGFYSADRGVDIRDRQLSTHHLNTLYLTQTSISLVGQLSGGKLSS